MSDIKAEVIKIIAEHIDVDEEKVVEDAHFIDDLGADSLDTVELVMEFENHFDIEISEEDSEKILTVGAAIDYIKAKKA